MKAKVIEELKKLDQDIEKKMSNLQDSELCVLLAQKQDLLAQLISFAPDLSGQDLAYLTQASQENKKMLEIYYQRRDKLSDLLKNHLALQSYLDEALS